VFVGVADPTASGFVASFSRPGGNVTGFTTLEPTMGGKWLEVLKEIAPRVARVAVLFNPATAPHSELYLNSFKAAAASLGVEPIVAPVLDASTLESVLAAQARESELPVQAPIKFELVINLKTAKTLGLDVPWILQQRADEVIE
jgi:ABC-type uncharacterized transport system substrate-binding protein